MTKEEEETFKIPSRDTILTSFYSSGILRECG